MPCAPPPQRHDRVAILLPGVPTILKAPKALEHAYPSLVAEFLQRRRAETETTQAQAAAHIGVTERTVLNWERGAMPYDRHYPSLIAFLQQEPWPEPVTLGEVLRAARRRLGLSIKAAAVLANVDNETFALWERQPVRRRQTPAWVVAFLGTSPPLGDGHRGGPR